MKIGQNFANIGRRVAFGAGGAVKGTAVGLVKGTKEAVKDLGRGVSDGISISRDAQLNVAQKAVLITGKAVGSYLKACQSMVREVAVHAGAGIAGGVALANTVNDTDADASFKTIGHGYERSNSEFTEKLTFKTNQQGGTVGFQIQRLPNQESAPGVEVFQNAGGLLLMS